VGRVKALAPHFEAAVHSLKGAKHVLDIRNYGLAAGFTIEALPGEPAKRPYLIAMDMLEEGLLRALRRRHHPARAALRL
jgi:beta-alanine--pyruvate transaminase